jgi:uncharacterized iron-regulated membrane protein
MKVFHKILFWSHLLAGVIAGLIIFIMSATGFILMYEHQMVEYAERDVREVVPPDANPARLSLDEIVAKARTQNPQVRPTGVVLRNEPTASIAVGFGRDGAVYVDPIPELSWAGDRNSTIGSTMSSSGTVGWVEKVKAARRHARSPEPAISLSSGLPSAEFISGGRAAGTGEE